MNLVNQLNLQLHSELLGKSERADARVKAARLIKAVKENFTNVDLLDSAAVYAATVKLAVAVSKIFHEDKTGQVTNCVDRVIRDLCSSQSLVKGRKPSLVRKAASFFFD